MSQWFFQWLSAISSIITIIGAILSLRKAFAPAYQASTKFITEKRKSIRVNEAIYLIIGILLIVFSVFIDADNFKNNPFLTAAYLIISALVGFGTSSFIPFPSYRRGRGWIWLSDRQRSRLEKHYEKELGILKKEFEALSQEGIALQKDYDSLSQQIKEAQISSNSPEGVEEKTTLLKGQISSIVDRMKYIQNRGSEIHRKLEELYADFDRNA